MCDGQGGGRRHGRRGRTNDLSAYGQQPNYQNDGGIFSSGFHTDNADFGNQYSAQNVQPTYGSASQQPQYGNAGGGQAQYGGGAAGETYPFLRFFVLNKQQDFCLKLHFNDLPIYLLIICLSKFQTAILPC